MKEYKGAPFFASLESVLNVNSDDVAEVCGIGLSLDEDREIAMLFAAAPELLSALQGMLEINSLNDAGKLSRFKAANAAIAKALGESQ